MSAVFALHTIGYGGVAWPAFLDELQRAEVQTVVDCRLVPQSKTMAEYCSEQLRCALGAMKIDYLWDPALGNPVRSECKAQDSLEPYRAHLAQHPEALGAVLALVRHGTRLALLCGCVNPDKCHRGVIAEAVAAEMFELPIKHLRPRLGGPRKAAPILGLTLKQPWPWALCEAGLRIVSCQREPTGRLGTRLAIHAGQGDDAEGAALMARHFHVPALDALPRGIVAVARLDQVVQQSSDPWFRGPYGWVLGEVLVIEQVPCRGSTGLWDLAPETLDLVRARYADAQRASRQAGVVLFSPVQGYVRADREGFSADLAEAGVYSREVAQRFVEDAPQDEIEIISVSRARGLVSEIVRTMAVHKDRLEGLLRLLLQGGGAAHQPAVDRT